MVHKTTGHGAYSTDMMANGQMQRVWQGSTEGKHIKKGKGSRDRSSPNVYYSSSLATSNLSSVCKLDYGDGPTVIMSYVYIYSDITAIHAILCKSANL
jgi:hypothetical protein